MQKRKFTHLYFFSDSKLTNTESFKTWEDAFIALASYAELYGFEMQFNSAISDDKQKIIQLIETK